MSNGDDYEDSDEIQDVVSKVQYLDGRPAYMTNQFVKEYIGVISVQTGVKGLREIITKEFRKKERIRQNRLIERTYELWNWRRQMIREHADEMWSIRQWNTIRESEKLAVWWYKRKILLLLRKMNRR